MKHFNYYYEDFQDEKLNLTDRVILSIISSFNEYTPYYQELNELIGITISNIKLSIKKLKELNLVQGNDKLELTNKTQGRYFRVDIEAGLDIKQLLVKSYIISLPYKAFYGSVEALSNVLSLSMKTTSNLLVQMTKQSILYRDKYGKRFKYSLSETVIEGLQIEKTIETPTVEEQIIEETPTIDVQPTTDVEVLNQRLTKASEICKQLFTENEKLKTDIVLLNDMINTLNKKINSLYDRQMNYVNLFQPVIERIDEIDSDVNSIYDLTDNIRAKQETELDMNILRGLI